MTQLICLVQRLSLGDSDRTPVKEGQMFEVDEAIAETYIKGGIARLNDPVPAPVEKQPEPAQEPVPAEEEKEPEVNPDGTVQTPTKKIITKKKGR